MEKKIIPKKNYIILFVIVSITITLTFLFRYTYLKNKDINSENTLMSKFLVKVNKAEFENYILENTNSIIYIASSKDKDLKEFETKLKQLVTNIGLENQMVFFDTEDISQKDLNEIKEKYFSSKLKNTEIGIYTNMFIVENCTIVSVLYNNKKDINIDDVIDFLSNRGLVGQA